MASSDEQPGTAIPEADRLEQDQPADPGIDSDTEWAGASAEDVDEADRLEQARPVPTDPDEDYAPDAG